MKVVINDCWGGFGLSEEALNLYNKLSNSKTQYSWKLPRHDPILIQVVETLGEEKASDRLAKLKIVEIPDGTEYDIDDYDGMESIHESHRSWS